MSAKPSRAYRFADILLFALLAMGTLIIFLGTLSSAQSDESQSSDYISLTLPTLDSSWTLDPRNPSIQQADLIINSSRPWSISVSSPNSAFGDGHMAEYDPVYRHYIYGEFISELNNPLVISAPGGKDVDLSKGDGQDLIDGCGLEGDLHIPIAFKQSATWKDNPLHNGHIYHIDVDFVAAPEIGEPPTIEKINTTPKDGNVDLGATATLKADVTGSWPITYQWFRLKDVEGEEYQQPGNAKLLTDGGHISGANTDTLTISNFDCTDKGDYELIVSNLYGSDKFSYVRLNSYQHISVQPEDTYALCGFKGSNDTASFSVAMEPSGDYSYQWQRSTDWGDTWLNITGAKSRILSFNVSQADYDTCYRAVISKGECSWISDSAYLDVFDLYGPENISVMGWGEPAYFEIGPANDEYFSYQWQVKRGSGDWSNIAEDNATQATYIFTTSADDSNNKYRVLVTDRRTGCIKTSNETIITNSIIGPEDQIVGCPEDYKVYAHFSVKPNSVFFGSDYTYQWQYSSDKGKSWQNINDYGSNRPDLYYLVDASNNGWKFKVHIKGPKGEGDSRPANLTVFNGVEIRSSTWSQIVCPQGTAKFSVDATGGSNDDPLIYQWFKIPPKGNAAPLSNGDHISDANKSTLIISQADSSDIADYYAWVRDTKYGSESNGEYFSDSARLYVGFPFKGPVNKTVPDGGYVDFWVGPSIDDWNSEDYWDYQWQESSDNGANWKNISNEFWSEYGFYATADKNGHMYRVWVGDGNSLCSASNPATLKVLSNPKMNISLDDDPDPVRPDGDLTYVIKYLNRGTAAEDALIDFNYDNNTEFVSSDIGPTNIYPDNHTLQWSKDYIDAYDSNDPSISTGTIRIKVHVNKLATGDSTLKSSAKISWDGGESDPVVAYTHVDSKAPTLHIHKEASEDVMTPGDTLDYQIRYENTGSSMLHNVTINDTIDKHLKFDSASPPPTRASIDDEGTHLWWSAADLGSETMPAGSARVLSLSTHLPYSQSDSNFDSVYNNYNISSKEVRGNSNTLETFIVHSLWIKKTADKQVYSPGEVINYTIAYGDDSKLGDAKDVVITDILPDNVEYLDAEPSPSESGSKILIWKIPKIPLGTRGVIYLYVKICENVTELNYKSSGYVKGEGFANVHQDLNTAQKPDHLTNFANITGNILGIPETKSSSATIQLADALGTEVSIKGHGSGSYARDEETQMILKNKSIKVETGLSENYHPTTFALPQGRSINYASKWSESQSGKNRITGASISEVYMYANKIKRNSSILLDKNGSTVSSQTSFQGTGHIGVLKRSSASDTSISKNVPIYESQENYVGNFNVTTYQDDYGSNVVSNRSVSGTGFASADVRLGRNQRSYESGTGSYQTEEQAQTQTSYISKDINVSYGPTSYSYSPDVNISLSKKWNEGMWSKSGAYSPKDSRVSQSSSVISEQFSDADYLNKKTTASGLNDMKTQAEFSGTAQFKVIEKESSANTSSNGVDLYDEYVGKYKLSRDVHVGGVARFNGPHISVSKVGRTEPAGGKFIYYVITVVNDGSQALGPIYIMDIFPQDTEYVDSSLRPSGISPESANWTLVSLGIGQSSSINLRLKAVDDKDGTINMNNIVNMVQATGGYDNHWVTASNISMLKPSWLSCCPPQLFAVMNASIDPQDPTLVHYNITLKNRMDCTMGATIIDQMPAELIFMDSSIMPSNISSDTITWNIIDIKPDEERTINYTARASKNGIFENLAHVIAYPADGTEPISTDVQSCIEIKGASYTTSSSEWQPPASFGLNYTQQGTGDDWMPCESCGVSTSEIESSAYQSCPVCSGSDESDSGYDIP